MLKKKPYCSLLKKRVYMIVVIMLLLMILPACNSRKEERYYSQKENYITVTGTVVHIKYNENRDVLYLGFSDLSPICDDDTFKIVGNNVSIVQENGIDEKISVGSQMEFITAPKYFGDGYVMPIVAVAVDGEVLLEFEDGYSNFMDWFEVQ